MTNYKCPACGWSDSVAEPRWRCPSCIGPLDLPPGPGLRRDQIRGEVRSLWRYAPTIAASPRVSLGEGWTPLVPGDWGGRKIHFKLEFLMPTGSFKDRGTAVMMSYLVERRVKALLEDSSGNAGASIAHYAAAAG